MCQEKNTVVSDFQILGWAREFAENQTLYGYTLKDLTNNLTLAYCRKLIN